MKKIIYITILIAMATFAQAQNVGINGTGANPNAGSILDLNTGNNFSSPNGKGLLPPNVSLTGVTDAVTITSPATSLLVYNTATANTGTLSVTPGYYYWDGSKWARFQTGAASSGGSFWSLLGNAGTVDGTNFLGTTDNVPLNFRVNNTKAGRIDTIAQTTFGFKAGNNNTSVDITAIGSFALVNNTGFGNTAVGYTAL